MDWQQKAEALQAIGEISIKLRKAGDWYVCQSVEIKRGDMLVSGYGNGATPEAAIEDHWRQLVDELPLGDYLVLDGYSYPRRAVRWSGFMWSTVRRDDIKETA